MFIPLPGNSHNCPLRACYLHVEGGWIGQFLGPAISVGFHLGHLEALMGRQPCVSAKSTLYLAFGGMRSRPCCLPAVNMDRSPDLAEGQGEFL